MLFFAPSAFAEGRFRPQILCIHQHWRCIFHSLHFKTQVGRHSLMRWPTLSIEHCNHFEFASASCASIGFDAQYCFSNLYPIYLQNLPQFHSKMRLGEVQFLAFVSGSKDAVMAHANKPRREYVQRKPAQELGCAQRHTNNQLFLELRKVFNKTRNFTLSACN
jgi:hypothetical protein